MLKYQNTVIQLSGSVYGTGVIPATKASVTQSASISPRKVQSSSSMVDGWGVNGVQEYQLSVEFPVTLGTNWTTNNGLAYLLGYTGENSFTLAVGSGVFRPCYLESVSLSIAPNSPIMAQAAIRMFDDDSLAVPVTGTPYTVSSLHQKICYGHNVVTGDLSSRSDQNINAISYAVTCQRTYSFPIWGAANNTDARVVSFLEAVDKKMTIQNRNVGDVIPYTGFSGGFHVTMSGANGQTLQVGVSGNYSVVQALDHNYEAGKNAMNSISLMEAVY